MISNMDLHQSTCRRETIDNDNTMHEGKIWSIYTGNTSSKKYVMEVCFITFTFVFTFQYDWNTLFWIWNKKIIMIVLNLFMLNGFASYSIKFEWNTEMNMKGWFAHESTSTEYHKLLRRQLETNGIPHGINSLMHLGLNGSQNIDTHLGEETRQTDGQPFSEISTVQTQEIDKSVEKRRENLYVGVVEHAREYIWQLSYLGSTATQSQMILHENETW